MILDKKVVLITGGTKGIGWATAQTMADEGATVYVGARHKPKTEDERIIFLELDVTDESSCCNTRDIIVNQQGKIDVLVANAGITSDALTKNMNDYQFDTVINTNLKGTFNVVKAIYKQMEIQKSGSIINVSSIVGEMGNIGQANYAASKAGIIAMTKTWAKEFTRKGIPIRVNSVAPGFIETDMTKNIPEPIKEQFTQKISLKRFGTPQEVADVICFLASDLASYVTGTVFDVNGGVAI